MSTEKPTRRQNAMTWARISAELMGWPMLIILVCAGAQKFLFTFTCHTAGFRCEYSYGGSSDFEKKASYGEERFNELEKYTADIAQKMNELDGVIGQLVEPPILNKK